MHRIPGLFVVSLLLATAPDAHALDSLEEVACICADDAINTGDYVSCVAHLSRRLVVKGVLSKADRAEAISEASRTDWERLAADCDAAAAEGECTTQGWGVSLETDSAFYRENALTGEAAQLSAVLRQWNFTDRDAFQVNQNGGDPACQYRVVVRDQRSNVVRQDFATCGPTFVAFDLPAGTCSELPFELPLAALNAETGLLDGESLPPGVYRVEATWSRQGPQAGPGFLVEGGLPGAAAAVRVLD